MTTLTQSIRHPRAFTLMELLVVITIIAILVSLTLAAGTKVVSVGRERGTQWAIQALDNSVSEYIQANGSIPPAWVKDPLDTTGNRRVPIIDGLVGDGGPPRTMDSTAWYVHQLQAEGSSALASIHQIDPKLRLTGIATTDIVSDATSTGQRTTRILDVWGNPIRYVHPRFAGTHGTAGSGNTEAVTDIIPMTSPNFKFTQFFRDGKTQWMTAADGTKTVANLNEQKANLGKASSDGGGSPNRRPYFYSAGPDGDPGTIDDNVYTIRPNFPR